MSNEPETKDNIWPPTPKHSVPDEKPINFVRWRGWPDARGLRAVKFTLLSWIMTAPLVISVHLHVPNWSIMTHDTVAMVIAVFAAAFLAGACVGTYGLILGLTTL